MSKCLENLKTQIKVCTYLRNAYSEMGQNWGSHALSDMIAQTFLEFKNKNPLTFCRKMCKHKVRNRPKQINDWELVVFVFLLTFWDVLTFVEMFG